MIALLGRPDSPSDGVEDYCMWLSRALEHRGWTLELVRVPWAERGWWSALAWLWRESRRWKGQWTLVQYTALGWSRRGFPLAVPVLLWILKLRHARLAIIFHDPGTYSGARLVDGARGAVQRWVMRTAYRWAERAILNVPVETVSWLPPNPVKAAFIPVGSNIPALPSAQHNGYRAPGRPKVIAVFGVTGGGNVGNEVEDIAFAAKQASRRLQPLRLVTLGRGSKEAAPKLRQALNGTGIEFVAQGVLSPDEVSRTLADSDVLLFVRGQVSSQRGSVVAGIASGLPVVAYGGPHTAHPITQAGVLPVPYGDREELGKVLGQVLEDERLWQDLHQRSLRAQQEHFSWEAIAERYAGALRLESAETFRRNVATKLQNST